MKRSSRVIDEAVVEMPASTVFYGRGRGGVLRITVKSGFEPTDARGPSDYVSDAEAADKEVWKAIYGVLCRAEGLINAKRRIVETDISCRGIGMGKASKMRYTIYVLPTWQGDDAEGVMRLVGMLGGPVGDALELHGFKVSDKVINQRWKKY